jgi:hypothetical protein
MNRLRRLTGTLVLLALGGIVALVLAEVALRLARPLSYRFDRMPLVYQHDDEIGYRYRPGASGRLTRNFEIDNRVVINSLGYHDIEHGPWPREASPRVVVIGDSFTAALHVPVDAVWTRVMEATLRQSGFPKARVANLGLDGTGTDVHLALLREQLERFRPTVVVLAFYQNDIADLARPVRYRDEHDDVILVYETAAQSDALRSYVDEHKPSPATEWLFEHSLLYRAGTFVGYRPLLLRTNFISPSQIGMEVDSSSVPGRSLDSLMLALDRLSRAEAFELLVVPVPTREVPAASRTAFADNVTDSVQGRLRMIDPIPGIERVLREDGRGYRDMFWRHDGHFETYGNAVFGKVMGRLLAGGLSAGPGQAPPDIR